MKIGIIGCGWAFDIYMASWAEGRGLEIAGVSDSDPARLDVVCRHYGLRRYENNAALLADTGVAIVVNLTPPPSHYRVTKSALEAGKHVYSEKPLTTNLEQARELFALAEANGLYLCCAPSNVLGDSAQTMWKAVEDGAVGDVRIVYAELDGSPLRLQRPETWRSQTGAPFPWAHELEMGCTWEHAGYYLSLMCAMFGPVKSVTAFSKRTVPDKMDPPLDPSDTPDFSVACLDFHSGIVGRLTCSIGPPWDHRFRVIGDKGMIATDTYRHYRCPVRLVGFTRLPMKGFQMASVRGNTLLQRLFGVNGRRLDLAGNSPARPERWWNIRTWRDRLREHEQGWQDKMLGVVELADAVRDGRRPYPPHDFTCHVTELTLAIQAAGVRGGTHVPESHFAPLTLPEWTRRRAPDYRAAVRPPLLERLIRVCATAMRRAMRGRRSGTSRTSAR